jgi:hypothetical protein
MKIFYLKIVQVNVVIEEFDMNMNLIKNQIKFFFLIEKNQNKRVC